MAYARLHHHGQLRKPSSTSSWASVKDGLASGIIVVVSRFKVIEGRDGIDFKGVDK